MQAYLIDGEKRNIEVIDINSIDDIIKNIGYDSIERDTIGAEGDQLFFDEECFLRGSTGKFQIDSVIPVSGKGILIGSSEDGLSLSDVTIALDDLQARLKYL